MSERRSLITRWLVVLLLTAVMPAPVLCQEIVGEPEVILLRADPEAIPADGQSSASITAEVRDRQGSLVPDGTRVFFTTTAGSVNPMMSTVDGVARATLRSAASEAIAEVTATAGTRAVARVRVTFAGAQYPPQQFQPFVRVKADSLEYIPDKELVDAAGHVELSYRGVTVAADRLQLVVESLRVKARGNVRVRSGGAEVAADLLALEMQRMQGRLVAMEENGTVRRESVVGYTLERIEEQERAPAGAFELADVDEGKAVITARKLTVFPGDKVQFSGFGLHVGGAKVLGVPFYVLSLNPYAPASDRFLAVDSVGGLSVNLPFYYSVTDSSNGSIRLRRQSRYGFEGYNTRPGWHLAVDQRYSAGRKAHGAFELTQITTSDWGVRWRHEQQAGAKTRTYLSVDSPAHRDIYARGEVYHSMRAGDLSLSTYGSFLPGAPDSLQSRLYFRRRPGMVKGFQYYWSANMAWSRLADQSTLEEGVDFQLQPPVVRLGRVSMFHTSAGLGYTASANGSGPTAQATAGLVRSLGRGTTASLRYNYYYSGRTSEFFGPTTSQAVTGQLLAAPSSRWNASLTATLMPATGDVSVYGGLMVSPFRHWRLEARPTYSRFSTGGTAGGPRESINLDASLAWQFQGRDLALRWSTLDHRIRFELAATSMRF